MMYKALTAFLSALTFVNCALHTLGFTDGSLSKILPPNNQRTYSSLTTLWYRRSPRIPRGQEWIDKSIKYYTTIMREERSSSMSSSKSPIDDELQSRTALKLYHALQQVRSGNLSRAENIYRKIIDDIQKISKEHDEACVNAELATTTLLLALVLQRMGDTAEARLVFHRFFRSAMRTAQKDPYTECVCTAKVLGAYALFEMKYGSVKRSIEVARRATQFDNDLAKVLTWKRFRDVERKIKPSVAASPMMSCIGEVVLPNQDGNYRARTYKCQCTSAENAEESERSLVTVIYYPGKPLFGMDGKIMHDVPIRIHTSSVGSEVFHDLRCKDQDELQIAMRQIKMCGGAIIYFGPEGRSSSVTRYAVSSVLGKSGHGSGASQVKGEVERYAEFNLIPSILQDIGVGSIRLVTNDISKIHTLRELGVDVRGSVPLMS